MKRAFKKSVAKPRKKTPKKPAKRTKKAVRKLSKKSPKKVVRKVIIRQRAPKSAALIQRSLPENMSTSTSDDRLPRYYGENKLVLLVRDPWWIFSYWEVTPQRSEEVEDQVRKAGHRERKTVLRVYDVTKHGPDKPDAFFDIELNFYADNWTIDVGWPDRRWMAELGLRTANGDFFPLVRSNIVATPSFGLSDVLDEEWMLPEDVYLKIIGFSNPGGSYGSMDIRLILAKYLKRVVSSESSPKAPLTR